MLSVMKLLLKREVGVYALNSHGNYIVDHGTSWKNHGIVFLNICGNPVFEGGFCAYVLSTKTSCSDTYAGFLFLRMRQES